MDRNETPDKKLIFFDIDGTLVNFEGKMPESTAEALRRAKQNGHRIIVCTGRNRGSVYDFLEAYEFDGWVCAAGAYVECNHKVISHHTIPHEALVKVIDYFKKEHILYGMQCERDTVTTRAGVRDIKRFFETKFPMNEEEIRHFCSSLTIEEHPERRTDAEKFIYYESEVGLTAVRQALSPEFEVTVTSLEKPDETSGEVTQAGITKSYGMKQAAQYFGADREKIIAFGDGPNDLDMMQYAGIGVAMGNAVDHVKALADMVTGHINQNGIYCAMERLKLI